MKKTLVKSRSKNFGAILTVSSLLTVNFLSPVAALAQGSPDIHMEEGDFVHDSEDIVLPDLSKLDELKTLEVERGHFDVSDIEVPNPPHQMEVEVGTFVELQRAIYSAQPDTALVINITNSFEFTNRIFIAEGLHITLQSDGDYTLTQRNGRHFMVESNSLFILSEGITLDGASQAGGVEVRHASFWLRGGRITNNKAFNAGGGIYVHNGHLMLNQGLLLNNTAFAGGAVYISNGLVNYTAGLDIRQNSAEYGGGMFVIDSVTNGRLNLNENSATFGGGMFVTGSTGFMNGFAMDNSADYGGGMFITDSTLGFSNMGAVRNSAEYGGGMYLLNGTVNTSTGGFTSNSAEFGGGVFLTDDSTLIQMNPIHTHNSATAGGGAYIFDNSRMTLHYGSISSNNAVAGGGVYIGRAGNFEMDDNFPRITGNHALQGGGVVVGDLATFTMRSGFIERNTAVIDCAVMVYPTGTFNRHEFGFVSC